MRENHPHTNPSRAFLSVIPEIFNRESMFLNIYGPLIETFRNDGKSKNTLTLTLSRRGRGKRKRESQERRRKRI